MAFLALARPSVAVPTRVCHVCINFGVSLLIVELLNALGDGEVLLGAVLAHDEETARLIELRVAPNLEVVEVLHLLLGFLMQRNHLFDELFVVSLEALTVLLQVEDGSALRLHFVDVQVVDAGHFITGLGSLRHLFLFNSSLLLRLLSSAQLVLNAEIVVSTLVLPELFERLSLEFRELEWLLLNGHALRQQFINQFSLQSQVGEGKLAAVIIATRIDKLEPWERLTNLLLDGLPVDFELFTFLKLFHVKLDDQGIVEVFLDKDNLAVGADLVFLRRSLCFVIARLACCLGISLAVRVKGRQFLVVFPSDEGVAFFDLDFGGVGARLSDLLGRDAEGFDLVASKEVLDVDPALLVGLDLLAEETIPRQVGVREVVLDLLLDHSVRGS